MTTEGKISLFLDEVLIDCGNYKNMRDVHLILKAWKHRYRVIWQGCYYQISIAHISEVNKEYHFYKAHNYSTNKNREYVG